MQIPRHANLIKLKFNKPSTTQKFQRNFLRQQRRMLSSESSTPRSSSSFTCEEKVVTRTRASRVGPEVIVEWETQRNQNIRPHIIKTDEEPWQKDFSKLERVAGLDISYPLDINSSQGYVGITICSFPSLKVEFSYVKKVELNVPYVPGYLAFRESAPLVEAVQTVLSTRPDLRPDVLMVDGNGMLHPAGCGSACHVGVNTNLPTIGVSKNFLIIPGIECTRDMVKTLGAPGDYVLIRGSNNEVLGMALKTTKDSKNPIYVSIGHRITLETAMRVVLATSKFRVPEPIRLSDFLSREVIRKEQKEKNSCTEIT